MELVSHTEGDTQSSGVAGLQEIKRKVRKGEETKKIGDSEILLV